MIKVLKTLLAIALVGVMVLLTTGCGGNPAATVAPKPQVSTVQRGSISIIVTGTGNLSLKNKQELSFGQTGLVSQASYAKISEVLIAEGAIVEQGQVLVKADTKDWQDQIVSSQYALDSAMHSLSQAKSGVTQAENNLLKAEHNVEQAEVSVTDAKNKVASARAALDSATYALYKQTDVQKIQDKIDNANIQLQQAKLMLRDAVRLQDTASAQYWQKMIRYYEEDSKANTDAAGSQSDGGIIGVYKLEMERLLAEPEYAGVTSSVADIKAKVAAVKQAEDNIPVVEHGVVSAQNSVLYAQNAVASAKNDLELAKNAVVIAQNRVNEAQKALDDDKNSSQEITAPFKGLITKVNVNKGDIVQRSANLIEIADPEKFIAKVMVTERDVMSVAIGGKASVSFDALTGKIFPAEIVQVAPLATVQAGVVTYAVTVELTSLQPEAGQAVMGMPPSFGGGAPFGASTGGPPSGIPAGATPPAGFTPPAAPSGNAAPAPVNLKDGLSATVTIPVLEKNDIIVVPSRAITRKAGGISTVQVVAGEASETRTVQTGLSDSINTEITEGLKEGEQVLIQISTSTSGLMRGGFPF